MKSKHILNYVFIAGLFVLLVNDHLLKDLFGNWMTGKLSDFAGLLIFPMFLKFLFPISTRKSISITVLIFVLWKSPFSQFFIDYFNSLPLFHIGRVVDYTDFIAFLVLPIAIYVLKYIDRFVIKFDYDILTKVGTVSVFLISIFAFAATSPDDEPITNATLISECCSRNVQEAEVGSAKIFIPSIFTPDGNGINDFFQISTDTSMLRIDTFFVFDQINGDTVFNSVNIEEIIPENGFDGVVMDSVIATQYAYRITVTSKDSITETFRGRVCCIPCVESLNLPTPRGLMNCTFSSQYTEEGGFDSDNVPNEDMNCFED